jgi:hypothetical protein
MEAMVIWWFLPITPLLQHSTASPRAWNFKETRQYERDDSESDNANDPARNW